MDVKGHFEVSDGNEEHVIGNWWEGNPWYKVVKNLAELCLCSSVLWKIEHASNEIGYLTQAIAKIKCRRCGLALPGCL